MEINIKSIVALTAIITTALSGGIFYAWTVTVVPGTKLITDRSYLETMQTINREILNPWFFIIFFGPVALTIWSSYLQFQQGLSMAFWLTISAMLAYAIGTFGITAFGNVPLNDILEKINLAVLDDEGRKLVRTNYETTWNRFQYIRTFFSVLAFVLLLIADRFSILENQ